jgi:hypothetical protein
VPLCPLVLTTLASEQKASHWLREMVKAEEEPGGAGNKCKIRYMHRAPKLCIETGNTAQMQVLKGILYSTGAGRARDAATGYTAVEAADVDQQIHHLAKWFSINYATHCMAP